MRVERTSCVHHGNTFTGEYQCLADGLNAAVRVRYKGEKLEAKLGTRLAALVAHDLLHELVVRDAIALKVTQAEKVLSGQRAR